MNKQSGIVVPELPIKDIIAFFSEINIEISAPEIAKPSIQSNQHLFDQILGVFLGSSELCNDDSANVIRQIQKMGILLGRIGISNFTIKDLSCDSRRLVQILSAVTNFGMYRESKRHIYDNVCKSADMNYMLHQTAEKRIVELREQIERAKETVKENKKSQQILEKDVKVLDLEVKELYRHQKDKASEIRLLKTEKTELGDKLSSNQLIEHNLKQEIACLKTQIVNDPTKLMELIDEMRELIDREKESIKALEASINEGNLKFIKLQKSYECLQRVKGILESIREVNDQIERTEQQILLIESQLRGCESSINAVKIRINHTERQISHLDSKIYNLQGKDKKCSEEIGDKIANLKIKYDGVSSERDQMVAKIQDNSRRIQELALEKSLLKGDHEQREALLIESLVELNKRVGQYFSELKSLIDM